MKRSDIKITLDKDDEWGEVYTISRKGGREVTLIPRVMAKETPNLIYHWIISILKKEPFEIDVVEY